MVGLATLQHPDDKPDGDRDAEKRQHGLKKVERQEQPRDRLQPAFVATNGDAQPRRIVGLGEVQPLFARRRNRQRRDGDVEGTVGGAVDQRLRGWLLGQSITKRQLIGDPTPKIDADASPSAVRVLYSEGRRLLGGDDQLSRRRVRNLCLRQTFGGWRCHGEEDRDGEARYRPHADTHHRAQSFSSPPAAAPITTASATASTTADLGAARKALVSAQKVTAPASCCKRSTPRCRISARRRPELSAALQLRHAQL